jgi:hypothetical protein
MDISGLVTQDKAESGEWFRVNIYNQNQDFELKILGIDSDAVQKFNRKQMKKVRINAGKAELSDEIIDDVMDSSDEWIIIRMAGIRGLQFNKNHKEIIGYEPVILEGRELKSDKESYQFLIEKIPAIKNFVLKISEDRTNFLSGKKAV